MVIEDSASAVVYDVPQVPPPGMNNVSSSWLADTGPLSALVGQSMSGTWTLRVVDDAFGDTGSLIAWHLDSTPALASPCPPVGPDCFRRAALPENGVFVAGGADGVPDAQQCVGDWNRDGMVDPADIAQFVQSWLYSVSHPGSLAGDVDCSQTVEPADIAVFVNDWIEGLTPGQSGCP